MNIYDECFTGLDSILKAYKPKKLNISQTESWEDMGKNQIILQNDSAYELGAANLPAVSSIAITDNKKLVSEDELLLIGNDLQDIKENLPFARIALIRVDENEMGTGDELYKAIRKIEFARYHIQPEGYMMRISAFTHREAVRISKKALSKGLNFANVGKLFIDEYKKNTPVKAVKLIFVTDPDFPYDKLQKIMEKSEQITAALDHIMKNIKMDCDSCNLKTVCEEVEALRDKDFKNE